jgi:hypothetical protein
LPSSALVTLASTRVEIPTPKRDRRVAAIGVALAVLTLTAAVAWPWTPEAASRPSPKVEEPMLVRLDPAVRPVAPPAPEPPKIDRFDPGY